MTITPEQLCRSGSEDGHQLALFCWCASSGIPELRWLFHIPNGGYRDKREAGKLKAMGVKPGVPDICLPIPKGIWHGLFIELKKPGLTPSKAGVVSDDQHNWLEQLTCMKYATRVCFGWTEARGALLEYLQVPMVQITNPQYGEWLNRSKSQ